MHSETISNLGKCYSINAVAFFALAFLFIFCGVVEMEGEAAGDVRLRICVPSDRK